MVSDGSCNILFGLSGNDLKSVDRSGWSSVATSGHGCVRMRGDDFRALKLSELQPYTWLHPNQQTVVYSVLGMQGEEKAGERGMKTVTIREVIITLSTLTNNVPSPFLPARTPFLSLRPPSSPVSVVLAAQRKGVFRGAGGAKRIGLCPTTLGSEPRHERRASVQPDLPRGAVTAAAQRGRDRGGS